MKIALIGPELEENLALRYIHASLAQAGHDARIYDFHAAEQIDTLTAWLLDWQPDIVGMSMVFTARALEYVELAQRLKEGGYRGHITAGGHFASFHARQILQDAPAIDSILHGEGEAAMLDLAAHLDQPGAVAGIVCRNASGEILETACRPVLENLDELPWPSRADRFDTYLGLPIANMLGSRGCFGNCSFCSIRAWHRKLGGPALRQRGAADIAAEMGHLYHHSGVRMFNFHDDNFFLHDHAANVRRFADLRREFDHQGIGKIAVQIKARPDSINAEIIDLLKDLGLFRVFLGVESNAVAGLKALGRGIRREQNHTALKLLREAGLHVTFNLLMFEPECSMRDLRENIDYIEASADVPLNFCRVEVYGGTPIYRRLHEQGRLSGNYWGYTYRLADETCQRAYEMFREVFTPRNFILGGANLRAMSVDYNLHVLRHFFPRRWSPALADRCHGAIARLNRNNVELLREICQAAEAGLASDALVADLSQRREAFDRQITHDFSKLIGEMTRLAQPAASSGSLVRVASVAAVTVLATVIGCKKGTQVYEMAPPATHPATGPGTAPWCDPVPPAITPSPSPTATPTRAPTFHTEMAPPALTPATERYPTQSEERAPGPIDPTRLQPATSEMAPAPTTSRPAPTTSTQPWYEKTTMPTHWSEMAPRPTTTTSTAPSGDPVPTPLGSQPSTSASQPAALDPAEAMKLALYVQKTYDQALRDAILANPHDASVKLVTVVTLDLDAAGAVVKAAAGGPGLTDQEIKTIQTMALKWTAPKPSRPGTISVQFVIQQGMTRPPVREFEMAPPSHPSEMAPRGAL